LPAFGSSASALPSVSIAAARSSPAICACPSRVSASAVPGASSSALRAVRQRAGRVAAPQAVLEGLVAQRLVVGHLGDPALHVLLVDRIGELHEIVPQERPVPLARQDLQLQLGHLVGRLEAVLHALRRLARVERVVGRVVVHVAHVHDAAPWQRDRRRVQVLLLPVEVPGRDVDQRLLAAVGQHRPAAEILAEVVRVRIDAVGGDVHRQRVRALDHVGLLARGDVDLARPQPDRERVLGRRRVAEVEPDRDADRLGLAGRAQVQLQHDVELVLEAPGDAGLVLLRALAGRPADELAVRRAQDAQAHRRIAGLGIAPVLVARVARAVDEQHGVVQHRAVVGAELERGARSGPPSPAAG
jgi:hypothetical protein